MARHHSASRRATVAAILLLPTAAAAQQAKWDGMPRMQLERQFAGPLQDTLIQRWRDPADGTVCYIYLPITAQHSPPTDNGYVQYGPNAIGSISCIHGPATSAPQGHPPPAPSAAAPPPSPPRQSQQTPPAKAQ
jgi:hypothetical protein